MWLVRSIANPLRYRRLAAPQFSTLVELQFLKVSYAPLRRDVR